MSYRHANSSQTKSKGPRSYHDVFVGKKSIIFKRISGLFLVFAQNNVISAQPAPDFLFFKHLIYLVFLHNFACYPKIRQEQVNNYLDVIISVGYRVQSVQGTCFRQWATLTARIGSYLFVDFLARN
jgi:hypothetical protein